MIQGFQNMTPSNSADVLAELNKMDVVLTRRTQSAGGQDDYVYSMVLSKQKIAYQFYVNSQTDQLSRVDLAGTDKDMKISFREDITQIAPLTAIPKSTFTFVPPPGSTQSASISVDPY